MTEAPNPLEPLAPEDPEVPADAVGWRRLDRRMLLIHPLQTLFRALPAILAIFVVSIGSDDSDRWELLFLPVLVAFGLLQWVTTRYRIGNGQIELRRGLFNKQTTTARLDRVRTVDLTSQVHHRVLGLAKVEISTGSAAKDRLVLDSLDVEQARRLRAELLHRVDPALAALPPPTGHAHEAAPPDADLEAAADEELLRLDPSWIRFAPFTMTGIASAGAIFGFITQGLSRFTREGDVFETGALWLHGLAWWIDVVGLLVLVSLLAVGAYVLSFWGFRLTRNRAGSLHTRRGLLTSREVSIDHSRLRGVSLGEPLGLRWARGRRLKAVSTGLEGERGGGSDWLAPPSPVADVTALAVEIIGDDDAVHGDLAEHGPVALRRRMMRAMWLPVSGLLVLSAAAALLGWPTWWLVLVVPLGGMAVWLGRDRYRGLGHRVTERHLITRSGSLDRSRVVLDREGIVGWKVERSFFQRRAGVATLVATTGAGRQHYDVVDLTPERAYALVARISPDLLREFS